MTPRVRHAVIRDFTNAFNAGLITLELTAEVESDEFYDADAHALISTAGNVRVQLNARARRPGEPAIWLKPTTYR